MGVVYAHAWSKLLSKHEVKQRAERGDPHHGPVCSDSRVIVLCIVVSCGAVLKCWMLLWRAMTQRRAWVAIVEMRLCGRPT